MESWTNLPIRRIEDLRDAVLGAGLEVTQMSTALLSGDLAFAGDDDVLYSSGLLNGQVALRGPLSEGNPLTHSRVAARRRRRWWASCRLKAGHKRWR